MPTSYARAPGVVPRRSFNSRVHQERKDEEQQKQQAQESEAVKNEPPTSDSGDAQPSTP